MAAIEALIGPLWPWIMAALSAAGVALYGRSKRKQGRQEVEHEQTQDDLATVKRVQDSQADSRAGGGDWRARRNGIGTTSGLCLGLDRDVQALSDALAAHPDTPDPVGIAGVDVVVGFQGTCG